MEKLIDLDKLKSDFNKGNYIFGESSVISFCNEFIKSNQDEWIIDKIDLCGGSDHVDSEVFYLLFEYTLRSKQDSEKTLCFKFVIHYNPEDSLLKITEIEYKND